MIGKCIVAYQFIERIRLYPCTIEEAGHDLSGKSKERKPTLNFNTCVKNISRCIPTNEILFILLADGTTYMLSRLLKRAKDTLS